MNLDILTRLSDDAILKLKEAVELEIKNRFDTTLRRGVEATFVDNYGVTRIVRVLKINTKTANCIEEADSVSPGNRWRVGIASLKVKPKKVFNPPTGRVTGKVTGKANDKPQKEAVW